MSKVIEVSKYRAINKGSLQATVSVHIVPWQMWIHEVKIFVKGASLWVAMPSKEVDKQDGTKMYIDYLEFDNDDAKKRFRNQVKEAVEQYLEENPDPENAPLVTDGDLPF